MSLPPAAKEALERLKAGNARFVSDVRSVRSIASQTSRAELAEGQAPFVIILSCSDSRAPSELLFDAGLGELFVVRVAGNIVAPSIVGSVEFAAAKFNTPLVVVMGHSRCGAVTATIDALASGEKGAMSDNVRDIVERISPAVSVLVDANVAKTDLLRLATRANVRVSVNHLRHGSWVLEERVRRGDLAVVGAEYSLETGAVEFFDGVE